jgi:tetratricopeptide (TPR) repeat protein
MQAREAPAPDADGPKRKPKPSTCINAGNFYANVAADPETPAARREEMREQARKAYQQALSSEPANLSAHIGLARLHVYSQDYERAVAYYQRTVQIAPRNASVWYELGMTEKRAHAPEAALAHLQRAVALDPENPQMANTLGVVLAEAGRYDDALGAFSRVNGDAESHYKLARTLLRVNQIDLGRQHIVIALQKNPRLDGAQALLAQLDRVEQPAPRPVEPVDYDPARDDAKPVVISHPIPLPETRPAGKRGITLPPPPFIPIRAEPVPTTPAAKPAPDPTPEPTAEPDPEEPDEPEEPDGK